MPQEEFVREVGVSFSTINQWEYGHRRSQPFPLKRLLEMEAGGNEAPLSPWPEKKPRPSSGGGQPSGPPSKPSSRIHLKPTNSGKMRPFSPGKYTRLDLATYQREYKRRQRAKAKISNQKGPNRSIHPHACQTYGQSVSRKVYFCPRDLFYRLPGISFRNGFFVTDQEDEQRRIEADPLYGVDVFSWVLEP